MLYREIFSSKMQPSRNFSFYAVSVYMIAGYMIHFSGIHLLKYEGRGSHVKLMSHMTSTAHEIYFGLGTDVFSNCIINKSLKRLNSYL